MFLISSNRSFPVHLCAVQCLIIPRSRKKSVPKEHRCFWHFWNVIQLNGSHTRERTTATTAPMAYGWEKRINWNRCLSAKSSLHILTCAPYVFACVSFIFGHASLDIFIYMLGHCIQFTSVFRYFFPLSFACNGVIE